LDVALPKIRPELDPGFVPAILWDAAYRRLCAANAHARELTLAIGRSDGTVFHHRLPLPAPEARGKDCSSFCCGAGVAPAFG